MLPFDVDIGPGLPVSEQLIRAVRKAVLTRQLDVGDRFPSVRVLSQELHISPTTAHKAVSTLKDEGYLVPEPGIGMVVSAPPLPSREERLRHLEPLCHSLLSEAAELHLSVTDAVEVLRTVAASRGDGKPGGSIHDADTSDHGGQ